MTKCNMSRTNCEKNYKPESSMLLKDSSAGRILQTSSEKLSLSDYGAMHLFVFSYVYPFHMLTLFHFTDISMVFTQGSWV